MDWTSILTILATGVVTTAGVVAKGIFDSRNEKERLAAEDSRAEADRTAVTAQKASERVDAAAHAQRQVGRDALSTFTATLAEIQTYGDKVAADQLERIWREEFDAKTRETIELVHGDAIREAMTSAADAMADYRHYVSVNTLAKEGTWNAEWLAKMLVGLAGCVARGMQPDDSLRDRIATLTTRLKAVQEYYEEW